MLTALDYGELIAITKDEVRNEVVLDAICKRKKDEEWHEEQKRKIVRYERKIIEMKG